jgi:N-acetylmuramoyl-L-alanine amidase
MRAKIVAIALVCLVVGTSGAQDVPTITGIDYGVHQNRVRLMFDVTPEPVFASFTLNEPDRLVIDFPALQWDMAEDLPSDIPYVGPVRYGLFRPDRARMVIELTKPVEVERIFTQPGHGSEPGRLVVDISPTDRISFDQRAGAPEQARWHGEMPALPEAGEGEIIVAIDPGHGGVDPGASYGRMTEKKVVLAFSKQLAAEIDATAGLRAYLTRETDVFVPLAERVARAHRAKAHIMISVHADSLAEGRASGFSAYTLSERATDRAAEALAARENRSDVFAGADLSGESDDLTRLLVELAQRGTKDESGKLATSVLGALKGNFQLLRTRPWRQANFRVLKAPDIPSILLEIGFLNSAKDRKRLADPEWRAKAVALIVDGIADWRKKASPGFLTPR